MSSNLVSELFLGQYRKEQPIVQRLISEGKSIFSRNHKRVNFQINGDVKNAYEDFYFEGDNDELTGWADDRDLSLRTKGFRGDPILEVIDWKRKGQGRYVYRNQSITDLQSYHEKGDIFHIFFLFKSMLQVFIY